MLDPRNNPSELRHKEVVCDYLTRASVNYMVIDHLPNHTLEEIASLVGISEHALLRVAFLQDGQGFLMVILPDDYFLDIGSLSSALGRELQPLSLDKEAKEDENNISISNYPPLPEFMAMPAVIEKDVLSQEDIYFKTGINDTLICMKRDVFMKFQQATKRINFSMPNSHLIHLANPEGGISVKIKQLTPLRIKQRVEQTIELPAVPLMASMILKLRFDPHATVGNLAEIIEKDPSLSAQLMSWASSPYYAYSGKINSLESAIIKVLGFDLVMNLALGIVLGRAMRVPVEGPMGLREYWRFALCCSALVETLVNMMPNEKRPIPGLAYLAGLLHNFGHLLLAQIFPPHFELLNRYVLTNPHVAPRLVEHYVLGVGHDQIGAWLLEAWELPPEVIAAVKFHHQEEYQSEYAVYSNLVFLATRLLKRHEIGDAEEITLSPKLLTSLGLQEEEVLQALDYVISQREDLNLLASQLLTSGKSRSA